MVGIRRTSAAAVKFGKAFSALILGVNITALKLLPEILPDNSLLHVSHEKFFVPHKLMAGIKVSPGRHGQIFRTGAAARQALCHTGTSLQIYHKMEKIESPSLSAAPCHLHGKLIIFFLQRRQIRLGNSVWIRGFRHHRLHGNLLKAQIRQMQHILRKVQIVVGVGSPHIVFFLPPAFGCFYKFRDNAVIASLTAPEGPHPVVDFLSPVDAQYNVVHLPIGKFQYLIVQKHAVCGKGETKFLSPGLFQTSAIGHQILYHLPVHQGLSPKEIHLQVDPVPGMLHQKIQGLFPHVKAHQRPSPMVLSLSCKAIPAGQVTVVGDVEAECLHHCLALFKVKNIILIDIRGEQLPVLFQLQNLIHSLGNLLLRAGNARQIQHRSLYGIRILDALLYQRLYQRNHCVNNIVHHMDGSAVHIHHYIVAITFILMYHRSISFPKSILCIRIVRARKEAATGIAA